MNGPLDPFDDSVNQSPNSYYETDAFSDEDYIPWDCDNGLPDNYEDDDED